MSTTTNVLAIGIPAAIVLYNLKNAKNIWQKMPSPHFVNISNPRLKNSQLAFNVNMDFDNPTDKTGILQHIEGDINWNNNHLAHLVVDDEMIFPPGTTRQAIEFVINPLDLGVTLWGNINNIFAPGQKMLFNGYIILNGIKKNIKNAIIPVL